MTTFSRYVAIGDSSTEGLEDPDGRGGYRGWADRLADHIAEGQVEPLEYANLAIRGMRLSEIRNTQFDDAMAMRPDLLTVFGGVNDALSMRWNATTARADLAAMFGEARARDITVLTFTVPDPSRVNPFGRQLKERMFQLNDILRAEAERYGVLLVDFQAYPVAEDRRLWYEDRLHGNTLGHELMAAALASKLGVEGFDESWASPVAVEVAARRHEQLRANLGWALRYLGPWIGNGIRGIPQSRGITAKRPVPTRVVTRRVAAED